jgi:hypothetical protein
MPRTGRLGLGYKKKYEKGERGGRPKGAKNKIKTITEKVVDNTEEVEVEETPIFESQIEIKDGIDKDNVIQIINQAFEEKLKMYETKKQAEREEKLKAKEEAKRKLIEEKSRLKTEKLKAKEEQEKAKWEEQQRIYKQHIEDMVYERDKSLLTKKMIEITGIRKEKLGGSKLNY